MFVGVFWIAVANSPEFSTICVLLEKIGFLSVVIEREEFENAGNERTKRRDYQGVSQA